MHKDIVYLFQKKISKLHNHRKAEIFLQAKEKGHGKVGACRGLFDVVFVKQGLFSVIKSLCDDFLCIPFLFSIPYLPLVDRKDFNSGQVSFDQAEATALIYYRKSLKYKRLDFFVP